MRITLEPHGRTFDAAPDEPILDAAFRARVALPHSCRGGSCGSCRARLLSGSVDYPRGPPLGLSADEAARGGVLLCRAHARTDVVVEAREIRRVTDVETKVLPCRVESIEPLSPGVRCLRLRLPAVEDFEFRPGQYLDVLLSGGVRRSYSIASPPHDAVPLELHVGWKQGGAFSRLAFDELRPGALLKIEGPLGAFAYEPDEAVPALFVAGGTGFAPLKSMLRHALETGSQRPLHFYWGARTATDLYAHAWLEERVARFPQLRYVPVLSAADPAAGTVHRGGFVHEAVAVDIAAGALREMDVYAAGPPPMIAALRATLASAGWPAARLRSDVFD